MDISVRKFIEKVGRSRNTELAKEARVVLENLNFESSELFVFVENACGYSSLSDFYDVHPNLNKKRLLVENTEEGGLRWYSEEELKLDIMNQDINLSAIHAFDIKKNKQIKITIEVKFS